SLTYWGLGDAGAWLGAPAGLVRADGTPKPSYHALKALIGQEWWVRDRHLRTDADGLVSVRGFAGDYLLDLGAEPVRFTIPRGGGLSSCALLGGLCGVDEPLREQRRHGPLRGPQREHQQRCRG